LTDGEALEIQVAIDWAKWRTTDFWVESQSAFRTNSDGIEWTRLSPLVRAIRRAGNGGFYWKGYTYTLYGPNDKLIRRVPSSP
jgi:galactose mutarotase-like enzyme